jgi:nucleotide-binding universal stress UspA family protein
MTADERVPLSIVTVIDWPSGGNTADAVADLRHGFEQQAVESLHRLAAEAGSGAPPTIAVRHGRAGREIVRYAREVHAELIVVGVSGHGALERMLPGSTAEHVLRDAPCPVLAVPASAATV